MVGRIGVDLRAAGAAMVGRIGVDLGAAGAAMVGRIGVDLRAAGCRNRSPITYYLLPQHVGKKQKLPEKQSFLFFG